MQGIELNLNTPEQHMSDEKTILVRVRRHPIRSSKVVHSSIDYFGS